MQIKEFTASSKVTPEKARKAFALFGPEDDPDDLADAKAPRTMIQYASRWRCYLEWCKAEGRVPMPAGPAQLLAFVRHLRKLNRAPATIEAYIAALATIHRLHGHAIDRTPIVEPMKAARRRAGPKRRVRPLLGRTLRELVERLDPASARDARDATMLLLGFAGALRSAEIVGLDWDRPGPTRFGGTGYLAVEPRGLVIELSTSKASQLTPVQLSLPGREMPSLRPWLDRWLALAAVAPGEPIFRAIIGPNILPRRLAEETVLDVVRRRMKAHALATGKSSKEALLLAQDFGGHSMRRGYCSTASDANLPHGEIRRRSRHSSDEQLGAYIETAEGWRRSGLKGVGF